MSREFLLWRSVPTLAEGPWAFDQQRPHLLRSYANGHASPALARIQRGLISDDTSDFDALRALIIGIPHLLNIVKTCEKFINDLSDWHDTSLLRWDAQGKLISVPCQGCTTCQTVIPEMIRYLTALENDINRFYSREDM
jgi:hypothetical protein